MAKHGPTIEEEVREYAMVLAAVIGKWSDDKWREGDWFMTIVCVARKLADQLALGQLDDRLLDIMRHHLPWTGEPTPDGKMLATWTPPAKPS